LPADGDVRHFGEPAGARRRAGDDRPAGPAQCAERGGVARPRCRFPRARRDAQRAPRFADVVAQDSAIDSALAFAAQMVRNAPLAIAGAKLILQSLAAGDVERRRAISRR
jgi:hypothetical protein